MDSDKKNKATTIVAFFVFLPAIAMTLAYRFWQVRKDLKLPNRDMWE